MYKSHWNSHGDSSFVIINLHTKLKQDQILKIISKHKIDYSDGFILFFLNEYM